VPATHAEGQFGMPIPLRIVAADAPLPAIDMPDFARGIPKSERPVRETGPSTRSTKQTEQ